MKHMNIILLTTIIISLLLLGCSNSYDSFSLHYNDSIDNSISCATSSSECPSSNIVQNNSTKKQAEITGLQNKYSVLLDSQKDYSKMTENEMETAQEIMENWNKLSLDFKSKYIKSKKNLQESINIYNSDKKSDSCSKKSEEIKASYDTGITYENISQTPDKYMNCKVKFTGRIIQAYGGDPENAMKIAIDGNKDKVILLDYDPEIIQLTFTDNDNISIRGHFVKTVSDLSMIYGETKIPKIYANYIEILE